MPNTDNETQQTRESLAAKNETWRGQRKRNAAKLIGLGVAGLALPVIPGALFIGGGLWLLFPNQTEKAWQSLKEKFGGAAKGETGTRSTDAIL